MKQQIVSYFSGNYTTFYSKYLSKVQKSGGEEIKAACPFHDDTDPSFNFNASNGKYFCHGCGKKGDIFHFYGKINSLDTRRDFRKILKGITDDFGIPFEQQKYRMVKAYDYTDAEGKLLFQVCRMEPKSFRQRQPNGNGKWAWNLKGVQRVLYRLPTVLSANEVLIVEGEKDADTLTELGFTATTCPMGAKKWLSEYNDALREKNIVLIPDNDNEGREHMALVGASLNGNSASLKLINLPNLPSKGDVSDFVQSFRNKEEAAELLSVLIENAQEYKPPKKATIEDAVLEINQFCRIETSSKQEYLFPWLKECSLNLISGWRGVGKTFFGISILDAVSRGEGFGPWECKKSVPCLLLDGEMAVQDIIERSNYLDLNTDRKNPLYIYSDAFANQLGLPRAHLASESWRTKMKSILTTRKIKLWIIDNLASLASGLDENVKKDWDPINAWLLELRFAGISTIMLHHVNKEGGQRGTSAREDNLDISILLKSPHDYMPEDGARFVVHFSKARVATKHLGLIGDTEFKLIQDDSGGCGWTFGNVRQQSKKEILRMIDEGTTYKEIAQELNVSAGLITKEKKKAIKDGYLTEKGKLTQSGFTYISETEN
jgi:5S rRNA maturation endonuclease (ribonuclease M5)